MKPLFNLLDSDVEPTDAQLAQLMRFVGIAVRERTILADQKFKQTLKYELDAAHQLWNSQLSNKKS